MQLRSKEVDKASNLFFSTEYISPRGDVVMGRGEEIEGDVVLKDYFIQQLEN